MKISTNKTFSFARSTLAGCLALLVCPSAGLAAKASVNASATVVAPVTISTATEMFFEKLSKNSFGSVLILGSSYQDPVRGTAGQSSPGAVQDAATFTISEGANPTYSVTLPENVAISDGSSNDATLNTIAGNSYGAYILSGTQQIISVVGSFNGSKKQVDGNYKGKLNFTVYYN
ncbi:MAG: DUF4402 domain-containing protein [Verrucomicrobia bacterium]|nr:DUF4402 domain-containing protein [Deltaproteobacteria bacterium]